MYSIVFISLLILFLKNPGIPGREYYKKNFEIKSEEKKNFRKCSKCNIIIPKNFRVVHCQKCEVCIKQHDHHCPWTGKCIGRKTIKYFYTFITSVMVVFVFFVAAVINVDLNKSKK